MSLLEKNTIEKKQVNEIVMGLAKLVVSNNKCGKYEVELIQNNEIYIKKSVYYLSGLY